MLSIALLQLYTPQACVPYRDGLGLSAPSPLELLELKLSQAWQWALGHRASGKPSSDTCRPRADQQFSQT